MSRKVGERMRRPIFSGLWENQEFRRFWLAQVIAQFSGQITFLALPLTAILILDATAGQMGIILAVMGLPALLIGLFIGVWVDRLRRRPLLIASNIGRSAVLVLVPLLAVLDVLRIEHLYIIAFLHSSMYLLFNVAFRSYLPVLIGREQLVEGNSKIELSRSASDIAGPSLAGLLVQIVTAPFAILVQVVSLLVSAFVLTTIDATEPPPESRSDRRVWREVAEGLKFVFSNPILRPLAACAATFGFFNAIVDVVILLFIIDELGLSAGMVGLAFSAGNVGLLIGALMPQRMVHWFGLGKALILALLITSLGDLLIPLATGPFLLVLAMVAAGQLTFGLGITIYRINEVSLRQIITPDRIQGRMNATMSLMLQGVVPAGALIGGMLGTTIGLQQAYILAIVGEIFAVLWLVFSPVRTLQRHPEPVEAG